MSVKSAPYYWLECDGCGAKADYGDFSAMSDEGSAVDCALDSEWTTDCEKHHCPRCPMLARCEVCDKPAGDEAGDRDDLCQECWDKQEGAS